MNSFYFIFFMLQFNLFVHVLPEPHFLSEEEDGADEYQKQDVPLNRQNGATSTNKFEEGSMTGHWKRTTREVTQIKQRNIQFCYLHNIKIHSLLEPIQFGIHHTVRHALKPERDLLMKDFETIEITTFPANTISHSRRFTFKSFAPKAFGYLRYLYGIQPEDFLISMCSSSLRPLSNPERSGSELLSTGDNQFLLKTVWCSEIQLFQKLLPGYYKKLINDPTTLLTKFFGLYSYQHGLGGNRVVVMNNLLPPSIHIHQKYDLKGSTLLRKAHSTDGKKSPTFRDLDFMEHHPKGIFLEADTYDALVKTIQKDCKFLASSNIMDYSFFLAIHNLDQEQKDRNANNEALKTEAGTGGEKNLQPEKPTNMYRLVAYLTICKSIQAESQLIDHYAKPVGIPAKNAKGERLLLYIGIMDILQDYRLVKKAETVIGSLVLKKASLDITEPEYYAKRFQDFLTEKVFKKISSNTLDI